MSNEVNEQNNVVASEPVVNNNEDMIRGLKEFVQFLKETPEFPKLPKNIRFWFYGYERTKVLPIAKDVVRGLGTCKKEYNSYEVSLSQQFGSSVDGEAIKIEFAFNREGICSKVKRMKEVDDWECEPILSPSDLQNTNSDTE